MKTAFEHSDFLGQPIKVGDYVSFTWSQGRSIRVGIITKLTKQRVKMSFTWAHEHNGGKSYYTGSHIARPTDVLVLGKTLQQQLTMSTLQRRI